MIGRSIAPTMHQVKVSAQLRPYPSSISPKACTTRRNARCYSNNNREFNSEEENKAIGAGSLNEQVGMTDKDIFSSLRRNQYWPKEAKPSVDLLASGPAMWESLGQVHVIFFGLSDDDQQEGIYSLRSANKEGLPQETIVSFESGEDAARYAGLLEVTMFPHVPHAYTISSKELADFCFERGYSCRLEPQGTFLTPPENKVILTDWERSHKLRSGSFAVLEGDPHAQGSASQEASITWGVTQTETHPLGPLPSMDGPMGETELNVLRSWMESLLP